MSVPSRNVYSSQRLKVVLVLLTLVTLPVVAALSLLIYHYMRFGVMVDRRLQGERVMVPSKVYARPLTLREGLPLPPADLLRTLNGLKYEERREGQPGPGQFLASDKNVTFTPRPQPDAPDEPLVVTFEKDHVKELRTISLDKVRRLLKHPQADAQALGGELLKGVEGLDALPLSEWLSMLRLDNPAALAPIAELMKKHVAPERLTLQQCIELVGSEVAAVAALGLEWARARPVRNEAELDPLLPMIHASVESVRKRSASKSSARRRRGSASS